MKTQPFPVRRFAAWLQRVFAGASPAATAAGGLVRFNRAARAASPTAIPAYRRRAGGSGYDPLPGPGGRAGRA